MITEFLTSWAIRLGVVALALAISFASGCRYEEKRYAAARVAAQVRATENTAQVATENARAAAPVIKEIVRTQVLTKTIVQKIPEVQYVTLPQPTTHCPALLTYADGVLIDAAATGGDSAARPDVDGPAYAAADVTRSVVENYGACREDQEKLSGLQDYVRRTLKQSLLCPGAQ